MNYKLVYNLDMLTFSNINIIHLNM